MCIRDSLCTDTSPETAGQVQAVDDRPEVPSLTYRDVNLGCSIRRTWTATDAAGNSAFMIQHIDLDYSPTVSLLSPLTFQCDSTLSSVEVLTSTASAHNPCGLPLLLTHEDSVSEFPCPGDFVRNWTVRVCNRMTSSSQTIVLYDLCPPHACGRNESIPRGICTFGNCQCHRPWHGEDCSELIYQPEVEPVNDTVLQEAQAYSTTITVTQGTPPLTWSLVSGPDRLRVDQYTGRVTWSRAQAGNYTISVQIENQVGRAEVTWTLQVRNGYNAFLHPVSPTIYPRAQPITLSGYVEYIEDSFVERILSRIVPVYIDITTGGTTRTIRAFTSRDGSFSGTFYPFATEYGSYLAGARHPGFTESPAQTQWGFLGLSSIPNTIALNGEAVGAFEGIFYNATVVCNDGPGTLNGLTATPTVSYTRYIGVEILLRGTPSNDTLEPGDKLLMDIRLTVARPLSGLFLVALETSQGTTLQITVNLRIEPILPRLSIDPPSVSTRIIRGRSRVFEFNVTNTGRTAASNVRSVLPNTNFISFISFGSSQESEGVFSLENGQSAVLSILTQTPESQQLGEISASIVIASREVSVSVPIVLIVSSDVFMNLTVIVEDEYTYFASGQPLVNDATVTLINYQRNVRTMQTTEMDNGTVTFFSIFEDRYEMFVEAPGHLTLRQIIITSVDSPVITVFIQRQAVTYTWTVTPVTFEDTYILTVEADFETHVPIPVVTVTPTEFDLEELELGFVPSIQLNITNHGLIRANDLNLELPTNHPFLEFSTNTANLGDLEPLTSITTTIQVSRRSVQKRAVQTVIWTVYIVNILYSYVCGDLQLRTIPVVLRRQTIIYTESSPPVVRCNNCGGGEGGGGGGGGGFAFNGYSARTPAFCNKCIQSLLSCVPTPDFPLSGCIPLIASGTSPLDGVVAALSWIQCTLGSVWMRLGSRLGPGLCIYGVYNDCLMSGTGKRRKRNLENSVNELLEAMYPIHQSIALGVEVLGDELWISTGDSTWFSHVLQPALDDTSETGVQISTSELTVILAAPHPSGIATEMVMKLTERLNNTINGWTSGQLEPVGEFNMASFSTVQELIRSINTYNDLATSKGFSSYLDAYNFASSEVNRISNWEEEAGVCAVVRIRIEQELAVTREAFLARLEIENQEDSPLEQAELEIIITDSRSGEQATHLFSIGDEMLSGSLTRVNNKWLLPSEMTGAVEWLIIPYSEAAPESDHAYDVGGTLRYFLDGDNVTIPLVPTLITVRPDPSLLVHYFWERYVVGDDPFTDAIEPSVPFTLGVAVKNAGHGTAVSLQITSGQPEIIENERGLLINFRIIGANVGNEAISPSLTVMFGDLTPNTTKVARWLLISSLQGEFMNYSATFENINPLGDPRLSILDELEIHELIRNIMIYSDPNEDDEILDFLVNERNDFLAYPDALYSSKTLRKYNVSAGTILSVRAASDVDMSLEVRTSSNNTGWVYYRYEDTQGLLSETAPAVNGSKYEGNQTISIPPENAWITRDRNSRTDTETLYLHIVDNAETTDEVVFIMNLCMSDCLTMERPFTRPTTSTTTTAEPITSTATTGTADTPITAEPRTTSTTEPRRTFTTETADIPTTAEPRTTSTTGTADTPTTDEPRTTSTTEPRTTSTTGTADTPTTAEPTSSTTASTTDTPRTTAEPTSSTTASTTEEADTPPIAEPTSSVTTSITGTVDAPTAAEPTSGIEYGVM